MLGNRHTRVVPLNACPADAVAVVGYGYDKKARKEFYTIKNSWGAGWGEQVRGKTSCFVLLLALVLQHSV